MAAWRQDTADVLQLLANAGVHPEDAAAAVRPRAAPWACSERVFASLLRAVVRSAPSVQTWAVVHDMQLRFSPFTPAGLGAPGAHAHVTALAEQLGEVLRKRVARLAPTLPCSTRTSGMAATPSCPFATISVSLRWSSRVARCEDERRYVQAAWQGGQRNSAEHWLTWAEWAGYGAPTTSAAELGALAGGRALAYDAWQGDASMDAAVVTAGSVEAWWHAFGPEAVRRMHHHNYRRMQVGRPLDAEADAAEAARVLDALLQRAYPGRDGGTWTGPLTASVSVDGSVWLNLHPDLLHLHPELLPAPSPNLSSAANAAEDAAMDAFVITPDSVLGWWERHQARALRRMRTSSGMHVGALLRSADAATDGHAAASRLNDLLQAEGESRDRWGLGAGLARVSATEWRVTIHRYSCGPYVPPPPSHIAPPSRSPSSAASSSSSGSGGPSLEFFPASPAVVSARDAGCPDYDSCMLCTGCVMAAVLAAVTVGVVVYAVANQPNDSTA